MGKGGRKDKERILRVNMKCAQRAALLQINLCSIGVCEKKQGVSGHPTDNQQIQFQQQP